VDSVTFAPSEAHLGQTVTLTATVRSQLPRIEYRSVDPAGVATLLCSSLTSATSTCSFLPKKPGNYVLTVRAQTSRFFETFQPDDTRSLTILVTP
jgi:hypothetical protein